MSSAAYDTTMSVAGGARALGSLARNTATQAFEVAENADAAANRASRDLDPQLTGEEQRDAIATMAQLAKNGAEISARANELAAELGLPKLLALPAVDIPASAWEDSSDEQDRSRLTASVSVCGVPMHVEALLSEISDDGTQEFLGSQGDMADDVYEATGGSGQWRTALIDSREYAIIITPYCN